MKKEGKSIFSPFAITSLLLFLTVGVMYIASDISYEYADRINYGIAQAFRRFMSGISRNVDFSIFEILIISIPIILFFVVRRAVKCFSSGEGRVRFVSNLAAFVLITYTGHILALGIAHNTTPISKRLGLDEVEITEDRLAENLIGLRDEINTLVDLVPRDESGVFDPGYSYSDISERICESYFLLTDHLDLPEGYDSRVKGVKNGWAMSYFGITGIYTYYSGEANVNTSYPAYVTLFTAAHEMSHQWGILREN